MLKISVIGFALVAFALAKDQFADVNTSDNVVSDKKVKEGLVGDQVDNTILEIIALHIGTHEEMILTAREAVGIAGKIKNRDLLEKNVLQDTMVKIMDIANLFKRKLESCDSTKGQKVDEFVKPDLANEIKKKFLLLHETLKCPEGFKQVEKSEFPFDWSFVEQLRAKLTTKPSTLLDDIIKYAQKSSYVTKETLPIVTMIATEMLKNPSVINFGLSTIDQVEMFLKSESGRRMVEIYPTIINSEPEEVLAIFQKEADFNQDVFVNLLKNDDLLKQFTQQAAQVILTVVRWGKAALDDQMRFAIVNGVLISNDFPPINKRHLLKSSCAIIEKCLRMFTTTKVEITLYDEARKLTDEFEKVYFKFSDFNKLSEEELVSVISKFMEENLLAQFTDLYLTNKHVSMTNPKCAEMTLCLLNERYANENLIVRTMVKGSSISMLYTWDFMFEDMKFENLYGAIFNGMASTSGKNCKIMYSKAPKDCDVFKNNPIGMNLSYDHNEL